MLKYVDRRGTSCSKWDALKDQFGEDGLLAMWVADMDFDTAEPIKKALHDYVENVPFGYYEMPQSWKDAFIEWEEKYHGYKVESDWICFAPGIVSAFYWVVANFTKPGDAVILLAPIYYPMMNSAKLQDRKLVMVDMIRSGNSYEVDFEAFEKGIVENNAKIFIMSSPHNPGGKIYTAEELTKLMEICRKHGVLVVSDEIHQDFEFNGHKHIPTATLGDYDDMLITMASVSKTFSLATGQNSFVIIPNKELRESYKNYLKVVHGYDGNAFGYIAAEAAMREGRPWFEEVKAQIWENYCYVKETLERETKVVVQDLQGTYLLWLDFGAYCKTQEETKELLQGKCKLALDYGNWFGRGGDDYAQFARMNLATSAENVKEACDRIIKALK